MKIRGGGEGLADWLPAVVVLVGDWLLLGSGPGLLARFVPLGSPLVVGVVSLGAFSATPLPL